MTTACRIMTTPSSPSLPSRHHPPSKKDQVSMTAKEVHTLAKKYPDILRHEVSGQLRPLIDYLLEDVGIDKVGSG